MITVQKSTLSVFKKSWHRSRNWPLVYVRQNTPTYNRQRNAVQVCIYKFI